MPAFLDSAVPGDHQRSLLSLSGLGGGLDEFGGNIQIGDAVNAGKWAALTVNGNVDIENGMLTVWVMFDGNGNLSGYDRMSVFGQFAVRRNRANGVRR